MHREPLSPIQFSESDANALADEIRRRIQGEVRFDSGSRALYATDASNYRQVPIGVVIPRTREDVVETIAACKKHGAPVLSRGGGTSLAGQCCNVAVVMDMSKYLNRIIDIDPVKKTARVEPGVVLDHLRAAAERFHLTFAPDPATHTHNTLGGMIGNNSCGPHSVMAGRTSDNVVELDIVTYEGVRLSVGATDNGQLAQIIAEGGPRADIYARLRALRDQYADEIRHRFPNIPRRVSGYNLDDLLPENGFHVARALVGSEGTCVTVLEATVRLVDSPPVRSLLVLGYPDICVAADHAAELVEWGPIALEGIDYGLVSDMKVSGIHPDDAKLLPKGKGWLMLEFGGQTKQEADANARKLMAFLREQDVRPSMKLFDDEEEEKKIWGVRESSLGATAHVPHKRLTWEGWEDSAVPPEKLGDYLRAFLALLKKYHYHGDVYGHFGQGCLHVRIDYDLQTADGIRKFHDFVSEAADIVVGFGGSLSGEHGDGQSRAEFLPKMFGPDLVHAFQLFKEIWDPEWKMNPGKVVHPYRQTENLRLGTDYNPPQVVTFFKYLDDNGDFGRTSLRCVGVGECRRSSKGTMCPSYRATGEEKHSTRGRARLLFEMLHGDVIKGGWREEAVAEALHLCLSCKGCKGDCPVSVDMATYKAEFHAHYYKGRLRPRSAYAFGLIDRWARLASYVPGVVNFLTQTPVFSDLAKAVAGVAPQRQIPEFATTTFKQWFARRPLCNASGPQVMLWPDTFNNYFHPQVAQAAVAVLEAAGYQVMVPPQLLCCGRPLYDSGMLDLAQRRLHAILNALQPQIRQGMPMVVLEPACASVFRDELVNLFPYDQNARRLQQQTYLLSEFLEREASHFALPLFHEKAIVHGHCHHKALMKMDDEEAVMKRMALDYQLLDSGCCGMAGGFGFEKDKYAISIRIGEQILLPAVRQAAQQTLIVADGYSCREQIAQTTGRHALHLAQVVQQAICQRPTIGNGETPQRRARS
jgi:FAD/FMN-containing dehydrogenase/Fe-S oxidoreductase